MHSTRSPLVALALTIAATLAAPAAASDGAVSIVIPTHDLNLTSAAGQRALEGRINRAARSVCATGNRSLAAITAENACIAAARTDAMARAGEVITVASARARRDLG